MSNLENGRVEEKGLSSTNKPKVKINGVWYSAGNCDVTGMVVGQMVAFEWNSYKFKGMDLRGLQNWGPIPTGAPLPATSAPGVPIPPVPGASLGSQEPARQFPAPIMDAERPAISNWVAAAIAAGLIKDRAELGLWIIAARDALRAGDPDEEIPF